MKIKPIRSGSGGNCYLVGRDDQSPALLIDAGLPVSKIKKGLWKHNTDLSNIDACLISHEHGDHTKGVEGLLKSGVKILMPGESRKALGLENEGLVREAEIKRSSDSYSYGRCRIRPFPLDHGNVTNFGYLISSGSDHLFYATDTVKIDFIFKGLTHLMIEVNYQDKYISEADNLVHKKTAIKTHQSLGTALEYLDKADLSNLKEIWVIHLSKSNANRAEVKRQIQEKTGVMVKIAR